MRVLVLVPASSPIETFKELLKVSRGKLLNVASNSIGILSHLVMELFSRLDGCKMNHAPYHGEPLSLADLVGGGAGDLFPPLEAAAKSLGLKFIANSTGDFGQFLDNATRRSAGHQGGENCAQG